MNATLLDEERYLCSIRTMYRILEENTEVKERRNQLWHPDYLWESPTRGLTLSHKYAEHRRGVDVIFLHDRLRPDIFTRDSGAYPAIG